MPADGFQWFIKPNCMLRGVTVAGRGEGFLPPSLLNEDVFEGNDASLMPGCFSRADLLCPRTWSHCLLYCHAPELASCLGQQCQGVLRSWLARKASGYVKSKARVLAVEQAVQRFGPKPGSPLAFGVSVLLLGASPWCWTSGGYQGRCNTRVSMWMSFSAARKSAGSCRASSGPTTSLPAPLRCWGIGSPLPTTSRGEQDLRANILQEGAAAKPARPDILP